MKLYLQKELVGSFLHLKMTQNFKLQHLFPISVMNYPGPTLLYIRIIKLKFFINLPSSLFSYVHTESIQCYSCKASGNNELEANIKCLEGAYLEECEEFYQYYNEVENGDITPELESEFYYYDQGVGRYIHTTIHIHDIQAVQC